MASRYCFTSNPPTSGLPQTVAEGNRAQLSAASVRDGVSLQDASVADGERSGPPRLPSTDPCAGRVASDGDGVGDVPAGDLFHRVPHPDERFIELGGDAV